MASPRESAYQIALQFEQTQRRLDQLLTPELKRFSEDARARNFIRAMVSGSTRHLLYLDWISAQLYHGKFKKMLNKTKVVLRLALYEIIFMDSIPEHATVNEYVKLARKKLGNRTAGMVNGLLRSYLREKEKLQPQIKIAEPAERISITHSFPLWLVKRWIELWGNEETERLCAALNRPPQFDLTIHEQRISVDKFKKLLDDKGIAYRVSAHFKNILAVQEMQQIIAGGWLEAGFCSVQDESAVIPVQLLNPGKGDLLLDVCSAPGGKYLQILEDQPGIAVAADMDLRRLKQVKKNVQRRGLKGAAYVCADGRHLPFKPVFNKILLDAPCSGLGVIRKHPDIKWRRTMQEIVDFSVLQQAILSSSSTVLRPGGYLTYGTCTLGPLENETVVRTFELQQKTQFRRFPLPSFVKPFVSGEAIHTFPQLHGTDGSFCVLFQKTNAST